MPQEASAVEWNKAYLQNLGKDKREDNEDEDDKGDNEGEKQQFSDSLLISINQYETIAKIGHGSMGELYHVADKFGICSGSKLEFVLKTYPGDLLEMKSIKSSVLNKDMLATEVAQLTSLSHPNIITLKEIIKDVKSPHNVSLVYEYADAGPLMHVTMSETEADQYYAVLAPTFTVADTGTHFNEKEAAFIFCQILDAIGHLQAHHVAHRNIQMSNILMTQHGQVKLIGFELSQNFSAEVGNSDTYGLTVETPGVWLMWSPEMCVSSVSDTPYCAFKADVWAVGVILYTMVCGKLPFFDLDPGVLFEEIIATTLSTSTFEYPVEISSQLQDLFACLYAPDVKNRPTPLACRQMEWLAAYSNHSLVLSSHPSTEATPLSPVIGHAKYKSMTKEDRSNSKAAEAAKAEKKNRERKAKHKLIDANGHDWVPKYFNKPTWCRICDDFIFGMTLGMQKAYKCRDCKMSGHLKCVLNYNEHIACTKSTKSGGGKPPKFVHTTDPTPVPNVHGHVWRKKFLKYPTWCKVCNSFIFGVTKEQQNAYKCLLCKTFGHRNCCEFYNEHGCSIGQFGVQVIKHNSMKKRASKIIRGISGEVSRNETLAMINQYEVSQELSNAISDQANLTVVIDTTNPDKESYLMRSFSGEKLKVPPFVLKRKDVSKQSEADLIHLEIELMRKMVHPNLQMIRDVISETVAPNNVHMVLELVDGGQILDSKPNEDNENLSPWFYVPGTDGVYAEEMASVIFRQLLSALVYLQRNHIAHRDLKPENVLITKKGVVKLTEFGQSTDFNKIANSAGCTNGLVTDTKGTWLFWAPEMCEDTDIDDADADDTPYSAYTADVWAAGVILYTMMMGTLPFWHVEPDSLFKLIDKTKTTPIQPAYPEGISTEYCELLEAMLSPDPSMRPSFEVCESFDWLQMHSNEENEAKLNEASQVLIAEKDYSYSYTPGNAFYLAVDAHDNDGDKSKNSALSQPSLYKSSSMRMNSESVDVDLTPEEEKEKLSPPEDINGHEWKKKFLNKPTFCVICKLFVWGLTEEQQGAYKCKCCKTVGHRHCCKQLSATECIPAAPKANSIGRDDLSTFQKKALSKLMTKTEKNWGLLRGASRKDGFTGVVVDAVKAGLHPPPNANGHVWRSKYLTKPTWCKVCDSFIFGVTTEQQNAYKCFLCKMSAHRDCCVRHNEHACMGGRKSDKRLEADPDDENKDKLAMINQYEVLKELGRGAYGKVYLITDSTSSTRTQYAMKTFPGAKMKAKKLGRFANKGPSEADLIRFEIKIMKMMSHPNVVRLTDAIEETVAPNNVHLVVELVDGGQILNSKPNANEELSPLFYVPGTTGVYDEKVASVIFRQLLAALVYLERNHIAHRDLKPENVLITKRGVVKLTDFGVSSDFSTASTEDERKGLIADTKGTWPFWAPEMCDETVEDGTKFSAYTADVWAAGVILYTMMMGTLPFWHVEPDSLFELITATQKTPHQPPYPEGISTEYCELLEAMLSPDPSMRPSFEVCESFDWLQMHSNEENEAKLKEASNTLIDRDNIDKELVFTPGNSYFLVADANNSSGSFYKNGGGGGEDGGKTSDSTPDNHEHHEHGKVKEPPEDINGHEWKRTFLNKPTWCKICNSFVWGLTAEQQGAYKCKFCKTFGHRHCCINHNVTQCSGGHSTTSYSTTDSSDSRKVTELEDLNGHAWHAKSVTVPRWCEICQSFIYAANVHEQYAFKCAHCKTVGHKECCLQRNQHTCQAEGSEGKLSIKSRVSSALAGGGGGSPRDVVHEEEDGISTPRKRPFGSGLLQRLSLATRSATKSTSSEKDGIEGGDDSI